MPRSRSPYAAEFKQEAVRLLRSGGRSPRQLAVELGTSEQTLRPARRPRTTIRDPKRRSARRFGPTRKPARGTSRYSADYRP
jgi:transposase-like protein